MNCGGSGVSIEHLYGRIAQLESELRHWQSYAIEGECREYMLKRQAKDTIDEPNDNTTFTIKATMPNRWIPHFLAMLKSIEHNGNIGHSGAVGIFADGDGDFHPKFIWDKALPSGAKPAKTDEVGVLYDAG